MNPAEATDALGEGAAPDILDTETIDTVIDSLLGTDPPPYVLAASDTGLAVTVPDAVPIPREHAIGGVGSALELCEPADLPAIIEAWTRARERRGARTAVHLRRDPATAVTLHFVDARHRFGVYLGIFVGTGGSGGEFSAGALRSTLFRPRVFTMERDEISVIRAVDPAVTQILGWTPDELIGTRTLDLIHADDRSLAIANWMEMLGRPGFEQRVVLRLRHRDGTYIGFEITNRNLLNDPTRGRVVSEIVDVSEQMDALEALRASEELLRRLTEALPVGVVQIDSARRIVYRNERVGEILGNPDAPTLDALFAAIARADRALFGAAVDGVLDAAEAADIELTTGPGAKRCGVAMRALRAPAGTVNGAILCITDITERFRLREELERRAKYDDLTRCHNRASILETLDEVMHGPAGANGVAVVFVDLDHFKQINDRLGHAAGDELLRLTGQRLAASVRTDDVVGRLGGDEFLVVCPDVSSPDIALDIAHRIAAALAQRAEIASTTIVPGSSIGVAWTNRVMDCDAMVAVADEAMYAAKRGAGGPVLALR